jgi:hypothetical protein
MEVGRKLCLQRFPIFLQPFSATERTAEICKSRLPLLLTENIVARPAEAIDEKGCPDEWRVQKPRANVRNILKSCNRSRVWNR